MMEKPKPSSGSESPVVQQAQGGTATDDREAEIARRLAALGEAAVNNIEEKEEELEEEEEAPMEVEEEEEVEPEVIEVEEPEEMAAPEKPAEIPAPPVPAPAPAPVPVMEAKKPDPVPVVASPATNNKSALLARIMAAQERAKQAQMKQAQQAPPSSMQSETQKMMEALNGFTTDVNAKKPAAALAPAPVMTMAPPSMMQAKAKAPPPSFDIFEKQMLASNATAPPMMAPPPPAFDSIAPLMNASDTNADVDFLGDFSGVQPMAPPGHVSVSAPSFDQVMNQNLMAPPPPFQDNMTMTMEHDDNVNDFELDEHGMKLSPQEKQKMIEEQRAIMEHIEREARNQKASEAAIKADAFANRMTGSQGAGVSTNISEVKTNVDGFSASEIEEQRKILEQIVKEAKGVQAQTEGGAAKAAVNIEIGGGHNVQLHGQEKTQEAIKKGTAQLVMCLNCNNWMQVVESATLMFCPICSVVTPVVQQDQIMSKAEILQMDEDRKLAEMLQAEEEAEAGVSDYPGNRRAATSRASAVSMSNDKSWWDTISDALVGVGVSAEAPNSEGAKRDSDYRAPGSMSSSQRGLHSAVTGEDGGEERLGLLGSEGGGGGRSLARVAQSKPLFSCVVDSISSSANAASTYIMGDDDEETNGVDTSSFLSVPNVGREKSEGGGNYFALPPNE